MFNANTVYRIVCARDEDPEVNMVYAEVGGEDYEVFGVFSGLDAGGGMFHATREGKVTVSDDPGEFTSSIEIAERIEIFQQLEKLRSEFEVYDESGELLGLSEAGLSFVNQSAEDANGAVMALSEGASDDFIYDCQDSWNLNYYLD